MDTDYLLIAVDSAAKYAVRFLSLAHAAKESLLLQTPGIRLEKPYLELLLAGTILGSRLDDQEATLFKLNFSAIGLSLNCEITPTGALRSAIFPHESRDPSEIDWNGFLKVVRLKKGDETYESVVEMRDEGVMGAFREYLSHSVQTPCVFFVNADARRPDKNYALWIEKLPDTSLGEWHAFQTGYADGSRFFGAIAASDDPDAIMRALFDEPIRILAVTKPKLTCSCNKERILDALKVLPMEDLTEIFMDGQGVSTRCDYCRTVFEVTDGEIKALLNINPTLH